MNNLKLIACAFLLSPFAGYTQTIIPNDLYKPTQSTKARDYYNAGNDAFDKKDFRKAIPNFRAAIAEDPEYIDAYDNLGLTFRQLNQLDSAEYYYQLSHRKYPKGVVAIRNLGIVSEYRGKFSAAVDFYKQSISLQPKDPEGYFSLARAYALMEKMPEAIENAHTAEMYYKQTNSEYIGDCYLLLCMLNIQTKKMDEARKYRDMAKSAGRELPAMLAQEIK